MQSKKEDFPPSPWSDRNFVPGEGPNNAKILILGEAPGKNENEQGKPFVGAAGNMLDKLLKHAGISREQCYITNTIKYQPPKNKMSDPRATSLFHKSIPHLIKEIERINPNVIVPVGNYALKALGFNQRIGEARGGIANTSLGKIIPTYHPAYIFRQFHEIVTCQRDWEKIARQMHSGQVKEPTENFNLNPTAEDVETLLRTLQFKVQNGDKPEIGLDIETYITDHNLKTPIKTIGISTTTTSATVVPFITQAGNPYWKTKDESVRALLAIGQILEDPNITKMVHNSLFDILVLMNHGFEVSGPIYDTMLGQYLVYEPSPHTLNYLVSVYADYQPWKLTADMNRDESFRRYNARDCVVMNMCKPGLDEDIDSNRVRHVFDILMNNIIPTCRMMLNGVYISTERYNEVKNLLEGDIENLIKRIASVAGRDDFNPESPQQMSELLFDKLRLKSQVKTKSGKLSTSKDVLNRLANRYPDNTVIQDLMNYREYSTRYKTFIKNLYIFPDNRVHTELKMHTAVTGRYSSSNPNMQNLPKRADEQGYIRSMYVAPPGRKIVTADYSQLELMIFAIMSEDDRWLEAFANGEDIHYHNGVSLMGNLYDDNRYRTFVKNFIYGLIYGSQGGDIEKEAPRELINKISVTEMLNNLSKEHPQMFKYRARIENDIRKYKYVRNAFGRKRWFIGSIKKDGSVDPKALRAGINHPIQSTAADIMNSKQPEIDEAMMHPIDMLILQLHDQFFAETDDTRVDIVAGHMKRIMEEPIYTPLGYEFNLKVDVEVGTSFSKNDLHKWSPNESVA